MSAVLLSPDLILSSRVESVARDAGYMLGTATSTDALLERVGEGVKAVLLDLTAPGLDLASLVATLRASAPGVRIIAFAPHVMEGKLQAARDAGCDAVLPRGRFQSQLDKILAELA